MVTAFQLILAQVATGFAVWVCLATIRGREAHRTYDARAKIKILRFFLPEREEYVRQQRLIARIALAFLPIWYLGVMIAILS